MCRIHLYYSTVSTEQANLVPKRECRKHVFNADRVFNEKVQRLFQQVGAQRRAIKWLMQKVEWQKVLIHSLWHRVIELQGVLAEVIGDDDEEEGESGEIIFEFDSGFCEHDFQ